MRKYEVKQTAVSQILADVHSDKIAIPELQRPFVWKTSQVRDLMDSLYIMDTQLVTSSLGNQ